LGWAGLERRSTTRAPRARASPPAHAQHHSPCPSPRCTRSQSVSLDLPEAGTLLWSFVRGMLGLYVAADGSLSVFNTPLPATGGSVYVPVPGGWPAEVSSVSVSALCVGARHNVSLVCALAGDVAALQCTTA
jgi:hypothetical protein